MEDRIDDIVIKVLYEKVAGVSGQRFSTFKLIKSFADIPGNFTDTGVKESVLSLINRGLVGPDDSCEYKGKKQPPFDITLTLEGKAYAESLPKKG